MIDPIDGSMNVRRTLPSHSLSIAVASGETMADVDFGFVHDFGAGEEFAATRGEGATLDGRPIAGGGPDYGLEVVGLESAEPSWILGAVEALQGEVYRLRVVGSIAITLAYVAAGRFDAMLSARPCRSVDAAAAQLIVREAGGHVEFVGYELGEATLDLDARFACAAAMDPEHLRTVRAAQDAGLAESRATDERLRRLGPGARGSPAASPATVPARWPGSTWTPSRAAPRRPSSPTPASSRASRSRRRMGEPARVGGDEPAVDAGADRRRSRAGSPPRCRVRRGRSARDRRSRCSPPRSG